MLNQPFSIAQLFVSFIAFIEQLHVMFRALKADENAFYWFVRGDMMTVLPLVLVIRTRLCVKVQTTGTVCISSTVERGGEHSVYTTGFLLTPHLAQTQPCLWP